MKYPLTSVLSALCLLLPVQAQEQRLRQSGNAIPEPAEYWEQLTPIAKSRPLRAEPARLKPVRIPVWQTRYTLGPGDTLNFSVYDRPDLNRENVQIAPDGTVSYLQAVAVRAKGLTLDQLRKQIEEKLSKYQDAKVIVTPVEIASKGFSIIGRVRKPGSYNLDRPTSILEALSLAQGVETGNLRGSAFELADFERSFVARKGQKLDVDLAKLYYEGDFGQNAFLEPDDYIYIASSLKNEIYVLGAVGNPGRFKMPVKLTIAQAISEAGDFDQYAYRMRVLLIRGSIHEPETHIVDMKAILSGRAPDIVLENRDIVFVNERPFELLERVLDNAIFTFLQTATAEAMNQGYNSVLDD
jgi:protein involved in polysaccharide export with SLBB domain